LLIRLPGSETEATAPTDIPEPTNTLEPTATNSPAPTDIPEPTATSDPTAGLPDFPDVGVELTYNPDDGLLYTPDGKPVFQQNNAGNGWQPFIPEDLAAQLPEGAFTGADPTGGWQIVDRDGNPLYSWDAESLSWGAAEITDAETPDDANPDLPPFPETTVDLTYVAETEQLVNPDGLPVFQLDAEKTQWVPVIPEDVAAELPEGTEIGQNETTGNWEIVDTEGTALYTWDWVTLGWVTADTEVAAPPLPDAPSPDVCPLAITPRLAVGYMARTVNFQNFRSSPEVTDDNTIYILAPTSELPVVGGPICEAVDDGARLWWQVTIDDGTAGWMAEGSSDGLFYFLEPVR